jgi:spore germination cell wall hydrolase CwlJ-like protein
MKRIIVTLLMAVMITAGLNSIAYAAEADNNQPVQENSTYETDITGLSTEDGSAVSEETTDAALAGTEGQDTDTTSVDGEPAQIDGYEIYIDEQGQVFYLEKEPEEEVIVDTQEEEAEPTSEPVKKEEPAKEKPSYSEKDLRLLASLIYAEAGNQSYNGMLGVANVVLNRLESPLYSHCDTIKEVIYDKKWSVQFAVTIKSRKTGLSMLDKALNLYDTGKSTGSNPEAEKKAMKKATKAAKAALEGENNIGSYLCFNAINKYTYKIKNKYPDYKIIGDHIFYRTK